MGKYDRNGVKHDGWVAVRHANQNHQGQSGCSSKSYSSLAKSQGVNLAQTPYKDTSNFSLSDWEDFYKKNNWYGYNY